MMLVSVKSNVDEVIQTLSRIEREVVPDATASAINKTLKNVEVQGVRALSRETGLRQKSIRDRLQLVRARRTSPYGHIKISEDRWPNIASFAARQTKKGVSSNAWGTRKVYKGSFLINSNRVAVTRMTKKRYPLKKLWGPSIVRVFQGTTVEALMRGVAAERWSVNFDHELRYRLARLRGRL